MSGVMAAVRRAAVAGACLGLVVLPGAASGGGEAREPRAQPAKPAPLVAAPTRPSSAFRPPFARAVTTTAPRRPATSARMPRAALRRMRAAAKAHGRARARWLRSPAARAKRRGSRTAFRNLSASTAAAVARSEHPAWMMQPAWRRPALIAGERRDGYLSDHVLKVERKGRRAASLMVSGAPLRTDGNRPVSVALRARGDGYEPEAPIVRSVLPRDPSDGFAFPDHGLTVRPDVADSSAARRLGAKLFYDNVQADSDLVAEALPTGIATYFVLRSPAAPAAFDLELEGGELRAIPDGGAELWQHGRRTFVVRPPLATDAQRQPVAVRYEVDGARLRVVVDHRGRDLAYPVLVDPEVVELPHDSEFTGWQFSTPWSGLFNGGYCPIGYGGGCTDFEGIWLQTTPGGNFPHMSYGWWMMQTPGLASGTTFVSRVTWARLRHWAATPSTCLTAGMWIGTGWEPGHWWDFVTGTSGDGAHWRCTTATANTIPVTCARVGCADGTPRNIPTIQQWVYGAGTRANAATVSVYEPNVHMSDYDNPTVAHTYWSAGESANGWTRFPALYGQYRADDPGLGLWHSWVEHSSGLNVYEDHGLGNDCDGSWFAPCPYRWWKNYTVGPRWDGIHQVTIHAVDIIDRRAQPITRTIKSDATPPELRSSGRLAQLDGRSLAGDAKLEVHALDGSAANPRSGVRYISIEVDDVARHNVIVDSCPAGSCDLKTNWTFRATDYSAGEHKIDVTACDWAGNCDTDTWRVTAAAGTIPSLQDGERTGRRLVLRAQRTAGSATGVRFQYRRGPTEAWKDVPADTVRTRRGEPIAWPVAFDAAGSSATLVWDVPATPGLVPSATWDGTLHVRGVLTGSPEPVTEDVIAKLVPSGVGSDDAGAQVGPVTVDLVTGNAALTATDVSIDAFKADLTVTRTYNSRETATVGQQEPLGPGWTLGALSESGGAAFAKIVNMAEVAGPAQGPYAVARTAEGDEIPFGESPTSTTYLSELGYENLKLERHMVNGRIDRYTLVDANSGHTLTFTPAGVTGEYALARVDQPGTADELSFTYDGSRRLVQMRAPAPPGISCTPQLVRGCRALEFEYAATTGGGDYAGRLKRIRLRAWDPQSAQMVDVPVAQYEYDASGRLAAAWDPRIVPNLRTTYAYGSATGLLETIAPPGDLPWTLVYGPLAGETDGGRLREVRRATVGPDTGVAVHTIQYGVPVSGAGAPRDMSAAGLDDIGQDDLPVEATAVFQPDYAPVAPVDYSRATIHYMNGYGRLVNTALRGDRLLTTEYDERGNVVRELTPANRARALAEPTTAARAAKARALSTLKTWAVTEAGARVVESLGPTHLLRTPSGAEVRGRRQVVFTYDEGRPDAKDYNLPTSTVVRARLEDGTTTDERVTRATYDFARRLPRTMTKGDSLTTTSVYDANGLVIEERLPRDPGGTGATTLQIVRYAPGSSPVAECGNRPEWTGLPCIERPAAQPAPGAGRHPLLAKKYEYDLLNNAVVTHETSTAATRTTTVTYDTAGRQLRRALTASDGSAVPEISSTYDAATGRAIETRSTLGEQVQTVRRTFDALGRLTRYEDAHGDVTTISYDRLNRPIDVRDGAGTRMFTYAPGRDEPSTIHDSDLGTITAEYDEEGKLTAQSLASSGLQIETSYDETGTPVRRRYVKQTQCAANCTWLDSQAVSNVHGQWLRESGPDGTQLYEYDSGGRLVGVDDRTSATSCVRRRYEYDADSNRTTQRTFAAAASCGASTPVVTNHAYDTADRIVDAGYTYDTFGRVLAVPAADAGGSPIALEYYATDLVRRMSQAGEGYTYALDPGMRPSRRTPDGGGPAELVHYGDDTDEPSWTQRGQEVASRDVLDVAGDLVAVKTAAGTMIQLTNLHGDVVAHVTNRHDATAPQTLPRTDEFGVPERPAGTATAAIQVVGSSWATADGSDTLQLYRPSGVAQGDVLLAELAIGNEGTVNVPAGWHEVEESHVTASTVDAPPSSYVVLWRVATASEPATYAFTMSGWGGQHRGGVKALRNVDVQDPIDAVATGTAEGYRIDGPVVTPTVDNVLLSLVAGIDRDNMEVNDGDASFGQLDEDWDTWGTWHQGTPAGAHTAVSGSGLVVGGRGLPADPGEVVGPYFDAERAAAYAAITTAIAPAPSGAPAPPRVRYGWLGAHQRSTELPSGVIAMGARVYLPQTGRFLQTDPVRGGSANAYDYANADPLNQTDLEGRAAAGCHFGPKSTYLYSPKRARLRWFTEFSCPGSGEGSDYIVTALKLTVTLTRHRKWWPDENVYDHHIEDRWPAAHRDSDIPSVGASDRPKCKPGDRYNLTVTVNVTMVPPAWVPFVEDVAITQTFKKTIKGRVCRR